MKNKFFSFAMLFLIVLCFSFSPVPLANESPPSDQFETCDICPNTMSVFVAGPTDLENGCLNTQQSGIIYSVDDGNGVALFEKATDYGYNATLPIGSVCKDQSIILRFCKYPDYNNNCSFSFFEYTVYISSVGGVHQRFGVSLAVPEGLCAEIDIGNFQEDDSGNCQFVEL